MVTDAAAGKGVCCSGRTIVSAADLLPGSATAATPAPQPTQKSASGSIAALQFGQEGVSSNFSSAGLVSGAETGWDELAWLSPASSASPDSDVAGAIVFAALLSGRRVPHPVQNTAPGSAAALQAGQRIVSVSIGTAFCRNPQAMSTKAAAQVQCPVATGVFSCFDLLLNGA